MRDLCAPFLGADLLKCVFEKVMRSDAGLNDPHPRTDGQLRGHATVTLFAIRVEPSWSDGAKTGDALQKARVWVERWDDEGVTHEFVDAAAVVAKAQEAQADTGTRPKASFGK